MRWWMAETFVTDARCMERANSGLNPTGKRTDGLTHAAMCPAGMAAVFLRCCFEVTLLGLRVKHRDVRPTPKTPSHTVLVSLRRPSANPERVAAMPTVPACWVTWVPSVGAALSSCVSRC
jgi:hypothetical protein